MTLADDKHMTSWITCFLKMEDEDFVILCASLALFLNFVHIHNLQKIQILDIQ